MEVVYCRQYQRHSQEEPADAGQKHAEEMLKQQDKNQYEHRRYIQINNGFGNGSRHAGKAQEMYKNKNARNDGEYHSRRLGCF